MITLSDMQEAWRVLTGSGGPSRVKALLASVRDTCHENIAAHHELRQALCDDLANGVLDDVVHVIRGGKPDDVPDN